MAVKVCIPDMSGPPVWWDAVALTLAAVGAASMVRHRLRRRK